MATYPDGALLTFDNTPGTNAVINVAQTVTPGSMSFGNNASVSYTFNGSAIAGSEGFSTSNTGSVTFNNANTFTGPANIAAGTVTVGTTGALADTSFGISGGATLTVNGSGNG